MSYLDKPLNNYILMNVSDYFSSSMMYKLDRRIQNIRYNKENKGITRLYNNPITRLIQMLEYKAFQNYEEQAWEIISNSETFSINRKYTFALSNRYIATKDCYNQFEKLEVASDVITKLSDVEVSIYAKDNTSLIIDSNNADITVKQLIAAKRLLYSIIPDEDKNDKYYRNILAILEAIENEDNFLMEDIFNTLYLDQELKKESYQFLTSIESITKENRKKELEQDIKEDWNQIRIAQDKIARASKRITENQETLKTIENMNYSETIQEYIDFLYNNPYIKDVRQYGYNSIFLEYEAPIVYYDEYLIECLLEDTKGYTKEIYNLFLNGEYELICSTLIELNLETFSITPQDVDNPKFFPHPHINRYHCLGTHAEEIYEWVNTRDYCGVTDQITAAVLNLNFSDGIVVNSMIETLTTTAWKHHPVWEHKVTKELKTTAELLKMED